VVVQGNLLMDGQAEMNRSFATHAPTAETTNAVALFPVLTDAQRGAVSDFLALVDALTASLAADDLKGFEMQSAKLHDATGEAARCLRCSECLASAGETG
jgi:Cu(I)/Ag(I) efflux system membrane fusion protein